MRHSGATFSVGDSIGVDFDARQVRDMVGAAQCVKQTTDTARRD